MKQSIGQPQGEIVLRAARTLYLFAAITSLVVIVGGLITALFFQMGTWQDVTETPLPRDYSSSPPALNADNIGKLLTPPQNIRFMPLTGSIRALLKDRNILGHFTADTSNGLASYPADFDILGGKDAALFDRVRTEGKRAGLKPAKALISKVNALLPTLQKSETATYELRVVARDRLGNRSKPEKVSFSLTYAPPLPANPGTAAPAVASEKSAVKLTGLQRLARDIALLVDPKKTSAYFDAYRRAQAIPKKCGASTGNTTFVSNFSSMFDRLRPRLTATNVEAFYTGVCSEWRRALSEQQAAQEKAREARAFVIAQNRSAKAAAEVKKLAAATRRNTTLIVVGAALAAFLCIALLLAFLAIENHTRAVRRAVETLTRNSGNQEPGGVENGISS